MTGFRKRTKEITQNKGHRETKASNIFKGKTKEEFGGIFFMWTTRVSEKEKKKRQCLRMFQIQRRVGAIRKDKHIKA